MTYAVGRAVDVQADSVMGMARVDDSMHAYVIYKQQGEKLAKTTAALQTHR